MQLVLKPGSVHTISITPHYNVLRVLPKHNLQLGETPNLLHHCTGPPLLVTAIVSYNYLCVVCEAWVGLGRGGGGGLLLTWPSLLSCVKWHAACCAGPVK